MNKLHRHRSLSRPGLPVDDGPPLSKTTLWAGRIAGAIGGLFALGCLLGSWYVLHVH